MRNPSSNERAAVAACRTAERTGRGRDAQPVRPITIAVWYSDAVGYQGIGTNNGSPACSTVRKDDGHEMTCYVSHPPVRLVFKECEVWVSTGYYSSTTPLSLSIVKGSCKARIVRSSHPNGDSRIWDAAIAVER